ncbi:Lipase [Daphnia magna]|uniref:Lipase n=1 Tax=Daphnia magna TaxID=35525 RepID=A0A164YQ62_9CRUS|nr:Lipase [Daphnia magna]
MLPSRLRCWWFALLTIGSSKAIYSSAESHHDYVLSRGLLEKWRTKTKNGVTLFDRLPRNVERSYTPPQVIEHRGFPVEVHHVTTEDGYILELHRIPSRTPRKVVFLQHGVLQSSGTWLVNPSSRSLAFLLAELSYDVWLGNFRGNRYSRKHTTLTPDEAEFWKFSWDEIGNYDIPSMMNYILTETGQSKLSYIGHSLGCGVALAPLSSFAYITTDFFRVWAPFTDRIEDALKLIGVHGWLDSEGFGNRFFELVCEQTYIQAQSCRNWFRSVVGPSENLDPAMIPLFNVNFLRGTSVSVIAQFAQNYNAGNVFQAYDFGRRGNLLRYGSVKPLEYDLAKITAPVYVFSGGSDHLVTPLDVDWLLSKLKNLNGSNRISDYSHLDFVWGIDVKEKLYEKVIALLPPP